ncbi:carbon-nitrogen family hydrolase [Bacteroidota bacterium]
MNIALIQYSPLWENPIDNIVKIQEILQNKVLDGVDLLIFPEMTLTGFTMNSKQFAEELDGISTTFFIDLSRKLKKHILAGLIEKYQDKVFNSLVHFDNQGLINARYRKIHPFSFTNEHKHFDAGNETVITKINSIRVGLSICYDLRFPELYRYYGKHRADIIINIANWPIPRIEHWKILLKARAIENQCFSVGVNRTGSDPYLEYNGSSAVFNPMGDEIFIANDIENIYRVDLNLDAVNETREKLPFLDDMKML